MMIRFDPPDQPGCYLFKDEKNKIIYVGKAKSLRKRVASYFSSTHKPDRTRMMVHEVADAEFIVVNNEVEALLLENRLIKQHAPHYNIMLKDDKRYAYLLITNETFPRLLTTRNPKVKGRLYGPYTDGYGRVQVQDLCQRTFKIRTCKTMPKRVCLLYHMGRCDGPCENRISKEEYAKNIKQAEQVLKGDIKPVVTDMQARMKTASGALKFEAAKRYRDDIAALNLLTQDQAVDKEKHYDEDAIGMATDGNKTCIVVVHVKKGVVSSKTEYTFDHADDILEEFVQAYYDIHDVPNRIILPSSIETAHVLEQWLSEKRGTKVSISTTPRGDNADLIAIATKNASLRVESAHPGVVALKDSLLLPVAPRVIEVFDISTIQGTNTVSAMIQFVNGAPNPKEYRKFIIKDADPQDDPACIAEVVSRRYKRLTEENAAWPDLIVIDGGETQLGAAIKSIDAIRKGVPIISLAKQDEEIYIPDRAVPLKLPDKNAGILMLRHARDTVHKFVITFHRNRRGKAAVASELDDIAGIGEATKYKLLAKFGSVAGIKSASFEEIAKVAGTKVAKALKPNSEDKNI